MVRIDKNANKMKEGRLRYMGVPLNHIIKLGKAMKNKYGTLAVLFVGIMALASCNKEVFDQQIYDAIVNYVFPIDPIDSSHNWNCSTQRTITVKVDGNVENMEKVLVLNYNPDEYSDAEVLTEKTDPVEGSTYIMSFLAPEYQTTFYAAIKTTDKKYYIVPFTTSDSQISFAYRTPISYTGDLNYLAFTYCFEEDFPEPGDYDFNDCVMRISIQAGDNINQVKMKVTLSAVGATRALAAAVNIKNFSYDQIEKVEIEDGKPFDEGYPQNLQLIPDGSTLQKGQNGEAVIRLFEDAMWCLAHNEADDVGTFTRYKVNVSKEENETFKTKEPITKTYIITLKDNVADMVQNLTLENLDPFIVTFYNSNRWEIHVFKDRLTKVLYDYNFMATSRITWGLCVPTGNFRWSLEGLVIGTYKDGILTGSYRKNDHSFGQWAANKSNSKDWFLYPSEGSVY